MRTLRYVFLLAALLVGVIAARDYWQGRSSRPEQPELRPSALTTDLNSRSGRWRWSQQTGEASKIEIAADGFRQGKENGAIDLTGVELRIFHGDDEFFDRVLTPAATFDTEGNRFHSSAETTITLQVPIDDPQFDSPG